MEEVNDRIIEKSGRMEGDGQKEGETYIYGHIFIRIYVPPPWILVLYLRRNRNKKINIRLSHVTLLFNKLHDK